MDPRPPFWFRHRQGKMEPAGSDLYRLTAPNLGEAFIGIRKTDGCWRPVLRLQSDGPDVDAPEVEFENRQEAWEAGFELYRQRVVV
jgi:hypothetical protein